MIERAHNRNDLKGGPSHETTSLSIVIPKLLCLICVLELFLVMYNPEFEILPSVRDRSGSHRQYEEFHKKEEHLFNIQISAPSWK